ncbi:hypothetical protein GCM10010371_18760 [Streptomyces subrutilus]|uniref:Uncharacterized protein n=1 Tax=Streptomyces subrutilus TaxID=36818 RepID=A0A918QP56_9ACTN|nr:hypothetical protein GCM10010371_18760 [Streptomyces subrutilus]
MAATFLTGGRLAAAVFFAGGVRTGAAFFAGAAVRPVRPFAVPAALGEPLPDVREAMGPRLPVHTPVDTRAHPFTRSCRPPRRCFDAPPDLTCTQTPRRPGSLADRPDTAAPACADPHAGAPHSTALRRPAPAGPTGAKERS